MRHRSRIATETRFQQCERVALVRFSVATGLLFLGAVASSTAGEAEAEATAVRAIPASVSTVVDAGLWGERGFYRVVVTHDWFEHVNSNVYVQWLSLNEEGQRKVEESVRVKKLSDLVGFVVGDVRISDASKQSKAVFDVDVYDEHSRKKQRARLHVGEVGDVTVQEDLVKSFD